jgi:L-ribulokinase
MTWDNGDRTVLVNPNLRGITLGWNLQSTAQDELFAAIEVTAFHTRVILDRMAANGVNIKRVINAGGIPQKNDVLNQVYANVLGRRCCRRAHQPGPAILAFLAAGTFKTIEDAQKKLARLTAFEPDKSEQRFMKSCIRSTASFIFLWRPQRDGFGAVLPTLIRVLSPHSHNPQ